MPPNSISRVRVTRVPGGEDGDVVAVEEPLEIRIGGVPVAVTMRTPGHDEELALGFCLSEGLSPLGARVPDDLAANTIEVEAPGADVGALQRNFYTSSSCGVCGKGALEAVAVEAARVESELTVPASLVASLPGTTARRAGGVRGHGRAARDRALLVRGRAALRSRGRRPAQRPRQGDRSRIPRRAAAVVGRASSASAAGSRSSSSRRRPLRDARCSSPSARRRRSRSSSPPIAGSRCAASSAAARSTSTRSVESGVTCVETQGSTEIAVATHRARACVRTQSRRVGPDRRLLVGGASSRFGSPKALAPLARRDAGRAGVADARRGLRRTDRRRQGRPRASVRGARRAGRAAGADRRRGRRTARSRDTRSPSSFRSTARS